MKSEIKRKKNKKISVVSFRVQREDEWEDGNVSKRKEMCLVIKHMARKGKQVEEVDFAAPLTLTHR